MKLITLILILFTGTASLASPKLTSNCKDANFDGLPVGVHYSKLQFHHRFQLLYSGPSTSPAGLIEFGSDAGSYCRAIEATYLKHKASGKTYVIHTTHDDYCDGGNTSGTIIDLAIYQQVGIEESLVGRVGDGEFVCLKK